MPSTGWIGNELCEQSVLSMQIRETEVGVVNSDTQRKGWPALVPVVVLALILYGPFLWGGKVLFWGTPLLQFWPWRWFAVQELGAGRLPLWNPYAGNGQPLLADHQSAVLYPLNLIFALSVERAMGYSLALHAVLAGVTMYLLGRELGLSRAARGVAALALAYSGYMVARGAFLTEISALPWLPLLWLYGRRVVHRRRVLDVALLAAVIALQFLAGHAQTWFYSLVSLALYGLWESRRAVGTLGSVGRRWGQVLLRLLLLLAALGGGVALAAAQFLPTAELSLAAARAARPDWEALALQYSMWPWRLITLLLPDFFGSPAGGDYWGYATYWEDAGYIGVLPAVFALLALAAWIRWRRRLDAPRVLKYVPPFFLLAALALLMALGKNTPFYTFFFRHVPGFDIFQAPARWLVIYTPAAALLAGVGIDALRPARRLTFVARLGAAGGAGIALTTLAARSLFSEAQVTFFDPLILFGAWFSLSMLLLLWGQRLGEPGAPRVGPPWLWEGAVWLVVAGDLLLAGWGLNPAADPALYARQTDIGAFLAADNQGRTYYPTDAREQVMWDRYLSFVDFGPTDLGYWWGMREALLPDLGLVERLPSTNSFEPLVEGRYYTLLQAVDRMDRESALRVLGMMNVAYLLDPAPVPELETAYQSPFVTVYRNPYLLPRAYVVCRAYEAVSPEAALERVSAAAFDPRREVVLEAAVPPAAGDCDLQPVTLLPSPPNQVKIRAVLSQPGYLVLADTFYPGWQVRLDDRRAELWRANYAFRAVALDAGEHEVSFVYRPSSWLIGLVCSGVAWVGLVIVVYEANRRGRTQR